MILGQDLAQWLKSLPGKRELMSSIPGTTTTTKKAEKVHILRGIRENWPWLCYDLFRPVHAGPYFPENPFYIYSRFVCLNNTRMLPQPTVSDYRFSDDHISTDLSPLKPEWLNLQASALVPGSSRSQTCWETAGLPLFSCWFSCAVTCGYF